MDLEAARGVFFTEARQLLGEVETHVLELEKDPTDTDVLNAAFRAAHTIKGSAGVFGLAVITHFVHDLETVLDRVRHGEMGFDVTMSSLVLECRDHISELVDAIEAGADPAQTPEELQAMQSGLTQRLKAYLTDAADPGSGQVSAAHDGPKPDAPAGSSAGPSESKHWQISVRLGQSTLCDGFDPAPILGFLGTFGESVCTIPVLDRLPAFEQLDPESCYLGFELHFKTSSSLAEIQDAFEFLTEESKLYITPHQCTPEQYQVLIEALPEAPVRAEALLQLAGFARPEAVVSVAVAHRKKSAAKSVQGTQSIRVPSDKLDALINLVGELVIANAGTVEQARLSKNPGMVEATSQVADLIEEIRDGALGLRMVQIGETFQRFQRVVRDLSNGMGKQIQLEISGEETELDKSVVEKIGDPLMHLVRNALDHGLETPEEREANGKSQTGKLSLNAYHDSGHIVIEVSDDGRGLSRERIVAKAIQSGIVSPEQHLTDAEVNMLIFAPGFSTAAEVTDISGRGVGMDVVKKNIEALRGSVQVRSREGAGTTFEIRLPLTLAIIDGFMIGVGKEIYVIPLGYVRECLELPSHAIQENERMDLHYDLRGEFLPCVRLRTLFKNRGDTPRRENIIVVSFGGVTAGIVADQLHGESQTVIKPLGALFEANRAISGATIMGNGNVALIIDVPKLIGEVIKLTRTFNSQAA
ncbi:MAG: chemotaxis protein CheA [Limnobacter sp.]|nr:chemotaxis protein CheA [Limnobacter sp.]